MELSEKSSKWSLFVVGIVGITFSAVIILFLISGMKAEGASIKTSTPVESSFRIRIPKIKVNAVVENLGLTPDGAMDSPLGPKNAAWYNLGTIPGEIGSAVINGHSGWKNGIPAVFDNLYKLKKGDKIYIEDNKGVVLTFVVQENRKYNPNADATGVFTSSDGKVHLNLITCTGFWNKIWKSHSQRLVVFADKEVK